VCVHDDVVLYVYEHMCIHSLFLYCVCVYTSDDSIELHMYTYLIYCVCVYVCVCLCMCVCARWTCAMGTYWVATVSRIDKITGLFCRIASLL